MEKGTEINTKCVELLTKYNPSAIISSEKPSRNYKGEFHSAFGQNMTAYVSKCDVLFDIALKKQISRIAIGDLGNEVGMGNIQNVVREVLPSGKMCKCPCEGGAASHTTTDALVLATMCDWGAYGLMAYLALARNDLTLIPEIDEVKTVLNGFAITSGLQNWTQLMTDDISLECTKSCLDILKHIVNSATTPSQ